MGTITTKTALCMNVSIAITLVSTALLLKIVWPVMEIWITEFCLAKEHVTAKLVTLRKSKALSVSLVQLYCQTVLTVSTITPTILLMQGQVLFSSPALSVMIPLFCKTTPVMNMLTALTLLFSSMKNSMYANPAVIS